MAQVDAITLQVVAATLSGIVREMQNSLYRTGYSTIIRESHDASCAILDAQGRLVGQHVVLPLHMGAFPACAEALLARIPAAEMAPGDAYIMNHPYYGGSPHASDMAVLSPVFHDGRLVAFCCSMAHKPDIGGTVPGSGAGDARELFHEGLQVPPVRYVDGRGEGGPPPPPNSGGSPAAASAGPPRGLETSGAGSAGSPPGLGGATRDTTSVAGGAPTPSRAVEAILRANSRTPDLVVGDLRGQVGCNRVGERRLLELFAKYGAAQLQAAWETLFAKTEERVRAEIARWPDGEYCAEATTDNDGVDLDRPLTVRVRVEKRGDAICFDFRESDDQARGPANIRPPLVRACCYYALIGLIDPHLPPNYGLVCAVEARFREGSFLDPRWPAAVNSYMPTAQVVTEAILAALGQMLPARQVASSGGTGALVVGGPHADGSGSYVHYEIYGSASGARPDRDGTSGLSVHLGNSQITPIEILESEFPVRLREFALRPDSGGAGRFRGGLGYRRVYEVLGESARLSLRLDRHVVPARGVAGGGDGQAGGVLLERPSEPPRALPSRLGGLALQRGDVLRVDRPGGGGYGDPRQRDPARVQADLADGYVTAAAAAELYSPTPE
jgi:N-methylhydantoinase B